MHLFGNMRPMNQPNCNRNINKNCCKKKDEPVFCNGVEVVPVLCCDKPKHKPKVNCNRNINKKCCIPKEPVFCNGVEQVEPLCGCVKQKSVKKCHPCKK